MNSVIIVLLIFVATSQIFDEKLFFYETNMHTWHTNREDLVLDVVNSANYTMKHGYAKVSFSKVVFSITLLSYQFLGVHDTQNVEINPMADDYIFNGSPLLGKKVVVAIYRVQHRNNVEGCVSQATAFRYLQYLDSHLRLLTGNRAGMDLEKSVISNICCPCSEAECYAPNTASPFLNYVTDHCKKLDTRLDFAPMTRLYLNDGFGGWAGLGVVGWIGSFVNNANYWAINNVNNDPSEKWMWEYNLSVIVHEFGHNLGFNHAGAANSDVVRFLKDYTDPNNYGDGGSVMGGGGDWNTITGPTHYFYRLCNSKVEPFWLRTAEKGMHTTIRLFAWDHPYSRPFVGINEPRFADDDDINGIAFKNNMLAFEFPWNNADMCSTVSESVKSGSFYLEYRNKWGGQNGAGSRGVRTIQGRVDKPGFSTGVQVMLNPGVDGLWNWADGTIPAGVLWVPTDADRGTVGVRITKINSVTNFMEETQLDDPVQELDKIPYMEVEVSYAPGVRYIPPMHPVPLPSYAMSPNVFGCHLNDDNTGYECKVMGTRRMWAYMKPFAHRGHPRVYNIDKSRYLDSAATAVVSLDGKDRLWFTHVYGDTTRGTVTMKVDLVSSNGGLTMWYDTTLYRKLKTEDDSKYKQYDRGDVLICGGLDMKEGEEVYLIDMYGHRERLSVDVGVSAYVMTLVSRKLPGCYEGIVVKETNGEINYSHRFVQMTPRMKVPRVAVQLTDSKTVSLSTAAIPAGKYSFPAMYNERKCAQGEWYPVMIQDWTFEDYILIDFSGSIPRKLIITLDSDNGNILIDAKRLEKEKDISLKITYRQLIQMGSFNGHIHYIMFSKTVTVISIRAVLASNVGNAQPSQKASTDYYTVDGYRYKAEVKGFDGFIPEAYTVSFNGKKYDMSTDDIDQYSLKYADVAPLNMLQIILVIVGIIVVILVVLFICCIVCTSMSNRKKAALPSSTLKPRRQSNGKKTLQSTVAPTSPKTSAKPTSPTSPKTSTKPTSPTSPKTSTKPSSPKMVFPSIPAVSKDMESNPFDVPEEIYRGRPKPTIPSKPVKSAYEPGPIPSIPLKPLSKPNGKKLPLPPSAKALPPLPSVSVYPSIQGPSSSVGKITPPPIPGMYGYKPPY